jgi:hypothetical protein
MDGTIDELEKSLKRLGWPFEELLDHAAATPAWWAELTPQGMLWRLRKVRRMSQIELGHLTGVGQSHVARIEAGADCRVSTLWSLFRGLGYKPVLVAAYARPEPRVDPRVKPGSIQKDG